jgi:methylated-DNA-protein-cysteine methyltransferase-like protein
MFMTARRKPSSHSARERLRNVQCGAGPQPAFVSFSRPACDPPNKKPSDMTMDARILSTIRKIPRGKVSTYGAIARAAGYPGAARQVVGALRRSFDLPWQRVLGAGGEIKLRGDSAIEQRLRLESEGVTFRGRRVNIKLHEFKFTKGKTTTNLKKRRAQTKNKRRTPAD